MKRLIYTIIALILSVVYVYGAEEIIFSPIAFSSTTLLVNTTDVMLVKAKAINFGTSAYDITGVTVTYTGADRNDIAPLSVKLWADDDGIWNGTGDMVQKGGSQSFDVTNKAYFMGLGVTLNPNTTKYIFVTVATTFTVTDENKVIAQIINPTDIGISIAASVSGTFPLKSLDPVNPNRINVNATQTIVSSWTTTVTAGQGVGFTVNAVDSYGNLDKGWTGSSITVMGLAGSAPSASATGQLPTYTGNGTWLDSENGQRMCGYTLYKAETGVKVRLNDSSFGNIDSGAITVNVASSSFVTFLAVGNQTAGVPFDTTLHCGDMWGNSTTGNVGSTSTISSAVGITASPSGQAPLFPASYCWTGSETSGNKTLSVTSYKQYTGAKLRVTDTVLNGTDSVAFNVGGGTAKSYSVAATNPAGVTSVNTGTAVTFTVIAKDQWGNTATSYSGTGQTAHTDDPENVTPIHYVFSNGIGTFALTFNWEGDKTIECSEIGNTVVNGLYYITVNALKVMTQFGITIPTSIKGSESFYGTIKALDVNGNMVTSFNDYVDLVVEVPSTITPNRVYLRNGYWVGNLTITGETLSTSFSVSGNGVTTKAASKIQVEVKNYEKAKTYPTIFKPGRENVKIRYYLTQDAEVKIGFYNMASELILEKSYPAGSSGGKQGLNVIEWDGKGGDNSVIGHSGAYDILIDKGYSKEWTAAIIKNY